MEELYETPSQPLALNLSCPVISCNTPNSDFWLEDKQMGNEILPFEIHVQNKKIKDGYTVTFDVTCHNWVGANDITTTITVI